MADFYNAGFRFTERKTYDNPFADPRDTNIISYLNIEAPEGGTFTVPDSVVVTLDSGEEATVSLRLKKLIQETFGPRGVILIDPTQKIIREEEYVANTLEQAKRKGAAIFKGYLTDKANEWFAIVEDVKASGRRPKTATGLFKHALERLGIEDPADTIDGLTKAKEGQKSNLDMQEILASMQRELSELRGRVGAK